MLFSLFTTQGTYMHLAAARYLMRRKIVCHQGKPGVLGLHVVPPIARPWVEVRFLQWEARSEVLGTPRRVGWAESVNPGHIARVQREEQGHHAAGRKSLCGERRTRPTHQPWRDAVKVVLVDVPPTSPDV